MPYFHVFQTLCERRNSLRNFYQSKAKWCSSHLDKWRNRSHHSRRHDGKEPKSQKDFGIFKNKAKTPKQILELH
jgi:hypothetical protein